MQGDGFRQGVQVIASLKKAHQAALAMLLGSRRHHVRHPSEGCRFQLKRCERVEAVSVEPGG